MEKLDLVKYDDKGQAYFDFDSLEAITSIKFVEEIKGYLERDKYARIKSVLKDRWDGVEVLMSNGGNVALYEFNPITKNIYTSFYHLDKLKRIADAMGGFEVTRNV